MLSRKASASLNLPSSNSFLPKASNLSAALVSCCFSYSTMSITTILASPFWVMIAGSGWVANDVTSSAASDLR